MEDDRSKKKKRSRTRKEKKHSSSLSLQRQVPISSRSCNKWMRSSRITALLQTTKRRSPRRREKTVRLDLEEAAETRERLMMASRKKLNLDLDPPSPNHFFFKTDAARDQPPSKKKPRTSLPDPGEALSGAAVVGGGKSSRKATEPLPRPFSSPGGGGGGGGGAAATTTTTAKTATTTPAAAAAACNKTHVPSTSYPFLPPQLR